MGSSKADWQELQISWNPIPWGQRFVPRPPIHIPGLSAHGQKPTKPNKAQNKIEETPSYDVKYQQRLPGF